MRVRARAPASMCVGSLLSDSGSSGCIPPGYVGQIVGFSERNPAHRLPRFPPSPSRVTFAGGGSVTLDTLTAPHSPSPLIFV